MINGSRSPSYGTVGVLIAYCCCNKVSQTKWLRAIKIYSLRVLEVRSPKWFSRAELILETLGNNLLSCLFQLLEAAYTPGLVALHHSDLCLHHHITSDPDFLAWLLYGTLVITLGSPG